MLKCKVLGINGVDHAIRGNEESNEFMEQI